MNLGEKLSNGFRTFLPADLAVTEVLMVGLIRSCYIACLFLLIFVIGDIDLSPLILVVPLLGNILVLVTRTLEKKGLALMSPSDKRRDLQSLESKSLKHGSSSAKARLLDEGRVLVGFLRKALSIRLVRTTFVYATLLFCFKGIILQLVLHPNNFSSNWGYVLLWSRLDLYLVSVIGVAYISALFLAFPRIIFAIEFALLFLLFVAITINHEAFQLTQLRVLSDLSWRFGFSALGILLFMGSGFLVLLLLNGLLSQFLYLSNVTKVENPETKPFPLAKYAVSAVLLVLTLCTFLFAMKDVVLGFYAPSESNIFTNGVSLQNEQSPLNFNSALGATRDPVGLIKLNREFNDNIYSPIIYFREDALSKIVGNVIEKREKREESAPNAYDKSMRRRVSIEFYPLIAEARPLAIDFPLKVGQIVNPNPARFKDAYRAESMALIGQLGALAGREVGSPDWEVEEKFGYLEKHPDIRYQRYAERVIGDEKDPVLQAFKLQQHLIENAIYTLAPNHEVKDGDDNTATFLFGDKRGYCVHFAHALVYMLRSLEIPSRIGTGYMTDIRRSVDGNVLLRMSDRHAWAEMFVSDVGWVTLDVQPEQIESHADSEVDKELLEELIDAVEQVKDDGVTESHNMREHGEVTNFLVRIVKWFERTGYILLQVLLVLGGLIILSPFGGRLYLRYSFKFFPKSIKCYYRSVYYLLLTDNFSRVKGETLEEFSKRVAATYGLKEDLFILYREWLFKGRTDFDVKMLDTYYREITVVFKDFSLGRKLRGYFNFRGLRAIFGV